MMNNVVKLIDPSGHNPECGPDGIYCTPPVQNIPKPNQACRSNADCYDAYLAYVEFVAQLGRKPTIKELLYATIGSEYWAYVDNDYYYNGEWRNASTNENPSIPTPRSVGREAVARQYYTICGRNGGCQGSELYRFLSGYEQWAGQVGATLGGEQQRGTEMLGQLTNDHYGTGDKLMDDVEKILNPALNSPWRNGGASNSPWQFFREAKSADLANEGMSPDSYAILAVITENEGTYLFMFTAYQTYNR